MGAGTSRSGSATRLSDAGAFVQQQEKAAGQRAAAQKQYTIDQRSQYENLPQSLRDKVSFEDAYADRGPEAAYKKAQEQYAIDQRSQYEKLVPQNLRDKISFEDAYADRGPAATREKNNTGPTRNLSSPGSEPNYADRGPSRQGIGRDSRSEYFDLDQFNRLKAEVDQQRSGNNAGIAFGPGRSNRGNISLTRQLQNRMQR